MSSFGRKLKRNQDLSNASKQLSKAVGLLQQLDGFKALPELKPVILETHQLVTAAIDDISLLAEEQAFQRKVIECLLRNDREAGVLLVRSREETHPVEVLDSVDVSVRHREDQ